MKITKHLLQSKGACASQVALFAETFPHGTEITEAVCLAVADKFDWNWAAQNLLPPEILCGVPARLRSGLCGIRARLRSGRCGVPARPRSGRCGIPARLRSGRCGVPARLRSGRCGVPARPRLGYQRVCARPMRSTSASALRPMRSTSASALRPMRSTSASALRPMRSTSASALRHSGASPTPPTEEETMEIDITSFFENAAPWTFSHSIAEGGPSAGSDTSAAPKRRGATAKTANARRARLGALERRAGKTPAERRDFWLTETMRPPPRRSDDAADLLNRRKSCSFRSPLTAIDRAPTPRSCRAS